MTIGARALVPDISVTDPQVLTTVPPDITAYTALDVLSHAIESYVSQAANFLSDAQALAAIRGVTEHLFPALDHPGDVQAREGLARASLQAGLAFTNALLGATHAISHQIGGLTDLPHGLLNAIMLPHVMEFNAPVAAERLAEAAAAMGVATGLMSSCEAADAAIQTVRALVGKASLPASLREIGVRLPQIDGIARNALDDAYIVTIPGRSARRMPVPSAWPPGSAPGTAAGAAAADVDESRLEQLIGVHSSKTGYYARWRGTRQDLDGRWPGCGPCPMRCASPPSGRWRSATRCWTRCRLFDAEWATLVLTSGELPSSVPSRFTWCREPGQAARVPSAQNAAALAARITNVPQVLDLGDGASGPPSWAFRCGWITGRSGHC